MATKRRRKNIPTKMREAVYNRDNWRCFYCGGQVFKDCEPKHARSAVIDHLFPFIKGGADEFWNYVTACSLCNSQKKGLTLDEFRAVRKKHLIGLIDVFIKFGQSQINSFDKLACSIINQGIVESVRAESFKITFYGEEVRRQALQDKRADA